MPDSRHRLMGLPEAVPSDDQTGSNFFGGWSLMCRPFKSSEANLLA